jgi:[acyl-carrier-protein] S-malonyltransferase
MAAVLGLDDASLVAACAEAQAPDEVVEAVNFNAPGQVVIAGHKAAVERAIGAAKARGARRALMLPVSAPFHSSLLKPAAEALAAYLVDVPFAPPKITVLHNVDVAPATTPDAIRNALARQAASPVRWVETLQALVDSGVTHILECGPGRVLTGLMRKLPADVHTGSLDDGVMLANALDAMRVSA